MSAERIYNLIEEEEDGGGQQQDNDQQTGSANSPDGRGGDKNRPNAPETPGGFGQVLDAPEAEDAEGKDRDEQARDWQIAVEQAETISKIAGKLPAGIERSLQGAEEARVDWRELLRRAWSETTPSDYSWMRPNRRHIWQGLYLPGLQREGVGEVVIFVDCSGSINARQLSLFEAEVRSILEGQRPERVYVVYFDIQVHKVDAYDAGQQIQLTPVGGGGTDFRPCFDWGRGEPCTAADPGVPYGPLRHVPEQAPPYPGAMGFDWVAAGAVRSVGADASGLVTLVTSWKGLQDRGPFHFSKRRRRPTCPLSFKTTLSSRSIANSIFLLDEIQEQAESGDTDEVNPELIQRFQQFCDAHSEKVDRIGHFLSVMEARAAYCRGQANRLTDRARSAENKVDRTPGTWCSITSRAGTCERSKARNTRCGCRRTARTRSLFSMSRRFL